MKKIIYIGVSFAVLLSVIYLISKPEKIDATEIAKADMEKMQNYFGDSFYLALFSVDELRPFSIIQFEKTYEKNTLGWLSPDDVSKDLTQNEKELLINKVSEYLSTFEIQRRKSTLSKVKCWCMAERNFNDMVFTGHISCNDLLAAIKKHNLTSDFFEKKTPRGPGDISTMSEKDQKQAYYEAINLISGLKFSEQLKFYSEIYSSLSKYAVIKN
jgi:hypothetical protein